MGFLIFFIIIAIFALSVFLNKKEKQKLEQLRICKDEILPILMNEDYSDEVKSKILQIVKDKTSEETNAIFSEALSSYTDTLIENNTLSKDSLKKADRASIFLSNEKFINITDFRVIHILTNYWLMQTQKTVQQFDVNTEIKIKKGEVVLWKIDSRLNKYKTRTSRVNFGGPVVSIKIMPGVRYRLGSLSLGKSTSTTLEAIDKGDFYITNKRLIFEGIKSTISIDFNKILSISETEAGLTIKRFNTVNPVFIEVASCDFALDMIDFIIDNENYKIISPIYGPNNSID